MSKLTDQQTADIKNLIQQGKKTSEISEKYPHNLTEIKALKSEYLDGLATGRHKKDKEDRKAYEQKKNARRMVEYRKKHGIVDPAEKKA